MCLRPVYFTLEDAWERLKCGTEKIVKLFAELDSEKGIGLIDCVRQGLGKPNIIYVKNFIGGASLYDWQVWEETGFGEERARSIDKSVMLVLIESVLYALKYASISYYHANRRMEHEVSFPSLLEKDLAEVSTTDRHPCMLYRFQVKEWLVKVQSEPFATSKRTRAILST